jgi:hypothetical protein
MALLLTALVLVHTDLIEGDDGSASTMRIVTLVVVGTFALLALRVGRNAGEIPSLENQGNWAWLVTAAIGGKAAQKYVELQEVRKPQAGGTAPNRTET